MLNQCNFIGRTGQAPEIRYSASGDTIASFSIACGEKWKDKQGQQQERTEWVNCTAFGKLAEIIGQYVQKGSLLFIGGKMQTDKWQDQNGNDRYTTKIMVKDMKMLDSKSTSGQQNQAPQQQAQQNQQRPVQQPQKTTAPNGQTYNEPPMDFDSDIPF